MFLILNRALSWAITSFGNKFCLRKRSRLIKAFDNRFYVKFMQLEIGLLTGVDRRMEAENRSLVEKSLMEEINNMKKKNQGTSI